MTIELTTSADIPEHAELRRAVRQLCQQFGAKFVASEASWQAGNICLDIHGGYGFVGKYNVERKFRETRVYQVAPGQQQT